MKTCAVCSGSLEGMSSRAVYCGKSCAYKAWYARHLDQQRERISAYQRANPEIVKAAALRWKQEHRQESRQLARDGYARNPETAKRSARARRARDRQVETCTITERDWRRLVDRYRGCCAYCGVKATLQREHVIPLARGGRHSIGNILPACGYCNTSKGPRLLTEWRQRPSRDTEGR